MLRRQIHRESMHLVHLSSNLMNKSLHPELAQYVWYFNSSYSLSVSTAIFQVNPG